MSVVCRGNRCQRILHFAKLNSIFPRWFGELPGRKTGDPETLDGEDDVNEEEIEDEEEEVEYDDEEEEEEEEEYSEYSEEEE